MKNKGKVKIEQTFDGLHIIVPSKKNWFLLIFGTVWMISWFFGFASISEILSYSETIDLDTHISLWLIVWIMVGIVITFLILWGYFGKEKLIIATDRNQLSIEKTVFNIGKKNRLDISEIGNIRTELLFGKKRRGFWGFGTGKVRFDYGLKTYSFGLGVEDAEAHYIVEILNEQFFPKGTPKIENQPLC